MSVALRPMGLGEILDRTFQIYRGRLAMFLGIALSPLIARLATVLLLGPALNEVLEQTTFAHSTKLAVRHLAAGLPLNILWGYFECVAWVVIAAAAAELFSSKSITLRSSFEICWARWKSWLGFSILLCIVFFLIPSFLQRLLLVRVLHSDGIYEVFGSRSPLTRLLLLTVISAGEGVPQCLLVALVALSVPAWDVERLAAFRALRRGLELGRSTWGRTSVAWLMCAVLQWMTRAMIQLSWQRFFMVWGCWCT